MACSKCDYKGYKETETAYSGKLYPSVKQCLHCDDVSAYSKKVKELLGDLKIIDESGELPQPKKRTLKLVEDE